MTLRSLDLISTLRRLEFWERSKIAAIVAGGSGCSFSDFDFAFVGAGVAGGVLNLALGGDEFVVLFGILEDSAE